MIAGLLMVSASHVVSTSLIGYTFANLWWIAFIRSLALQYLATILLILAVALVFYFIPNERARFRDVWAGAILIGVLWRGGFEVFSWMTIATPKPDRQRLDRRGGGVPAVDLRVVGDPDVRRGVDGDYARQASCARDPGRRLTAASKGPRAQSSRGRAESVSAAAPGQPGRLVSVGRRGFRAGARAKTSRSSCRSATRPATGAT